MPDRSPTATLRTFNRTWSQRIGVLDDSFLGTGLPLGAARLLFEIGPGGTTARELRARLDLDSGYLTRLLGRLQDAGHVEVVPDPGDRRRRLVRLTARGRRTWRRLDDRSEALAERLVDALPPSQRQRLTEALATADLLVRAATVQVRATDPRDPLAAAAVDSYYAELDRRFPGGFDPGDVRYAGGPEDDPGTLLLALSDGRPVACGAVHRVDTATAEIKRMWVDPAWRGAGLGRRLLRHLEREAAGLGARRVVLDTNASLTEAIAMYERAGYRHVERYNDNPYAQAWFAKALTEARRVTDVAGPRAPRAR